MNKGSDMQQMKIDIIRQRIESGFYFQQIVYEVIAQKVWAEWQKEKHSS